MKQEKTNRRAFMKGIGAASALVSLGAAKNSWAATAKPYSRSMSAMGTLVTIDVFGAKEAPAREGVKAAFEEIRRIETMMTTHSEMSALSRLNARAGSEMIEADARLAEVLRASVRWSEATAGEFDVTTLPLLKAWGFREEAKDIPASVEAARAVVSYRHIAIEDGKAGLKTKGAGIDVGGIAKGYAVDRAAAILREKWGIERAIINAGGDLYCIGRPDDAAGWKIALQHPRAEGSCAVIIAPADMAIATSGDYAGTLVGEGKSHCDKFDPFTGKPAAEFMSVTTCAKTCMDADASAVALFIGGRKVAAAVERMGISSLLVAGDGAGLKLEPSSAFPAYHTV